MSTQPESGRRGILAAGNWIIDHTKIIDVYPAQDALCNILGESFSNGGSPYNLLVDLAHLGATFPLEALGLIGDDKDGEAIRTDCARHGIDVRQLRTTPDAHTSYTDVMSVRTTGRRTFFHQRGANALLGPEHFDFTASRAKFFHLGYLLLLDRLDQPDPDHGTVAAGLLAQARAAGFVTSIDVVSEDSARFPEIVRPALPHTDHAILNEFEAERTTGCAIRTERGLDTAQLRTAARAARCRRAPVGRHPFPRRRPRRACRRPRPLPRQRAFTAGRNRRNHRRRRRLRCGPALRPARRPPDGRMPARRRLRRRRLPDRRELLRRHHVARAKP